MLISTGGVSAGEEDHVVPAFKRGGGELALLKVAMRPGKPVKVGTMKEMLFCRLARKSERRAGDVLARSRGRR